MCVCAFWGSIFFSEFVSIHLALYSDDTPLQLVTNLAGIYGLKIFLASVEILGLKGFILCHFCDKRRPKMTVPPCRSLKSKLHFSTRRLLCTACHPGCKQPLQTRTDCSQSPQIISDCSQSPQTRTDCNEPPQTRTDA